MDESDFHRFDQGHQLLNPLAQEFIPSRPIPNHCLPLLPYPIFYLYPSYPTIFLPAYVSSIEPPPPPVRLSLPPPPPPCNFPSRSLLLSSVPTNVSESTLKKELEIYGDVRAIEMERLSDGIVTVHFYDLRNAHAALMEIQEKYMQYQLRLKMHYDAVLMHNPLIRLLPPPPPTPLPQPARGLISGQVVWAQYTFSALYSISDGYNQGTLVILNLDSPVSPSSLRQIFEAFGPVREFRYNPRNMNQKFVEYYDTRDAAKALTELNGKEINGKHMDLRFAKLRGHVSRFDTVNNTSDPITPGTNGDDNYSSVGSGEDPTASMEAQLGEFDNQRPPELSHPLSNLQMQQNISIHIPVSDSASPSQKSIAFERPPLSLENSFETNSTTSKCMDRTKPYTRISNDGDNSNLGRVAEKRFKVSSNFKKNDPHFVINEDAITESNYRDSRTTVMIKNIPNKYSLKLLLDLLDKHCKECNDQIAANGDDEPLSSYDFVYLPIDFINECNMGYGFVNMTSPEATLRLYKALHLQSWPVLNSRKIAQVAYARLQGLEALREHFKTSKFPLKEDYMPVMFSPPRDGRQLTEPLPVGGFTV